MKVEHITRIYIDVIHEDEVEEATYPALQPTAAKRAQECLKTIDKVLQNSREVNRLGIFETGYDQAWAYVYDEDGAQEDFSFDSNDLDY